MKRFAFFLAVIGLLAAAWHFRPSVPDEWTAADLAVLQSLSLDALGPPPPDPSNAVADDSRAARFGHKLFFDPRLSANDGISCSTCHQPIRHFTDGLPKGQAIGTSRRNTASIVGSAYSPWQYWDGRRDSQWSQALSPLEDPNEHGGNRRDVVELVGKDPDYRVAYEQLFGPLPDAADEAGIDAAFANVGKAIAAYERLLLPGRSRFDDYVAALLAGDDEAQSRLYSADEIVGLQLFIGKANCLQCHNGPLLTNHEFHNTGVLSFPGEVPDKGRVAGVREVLADPFNCSGVYSDAKQCPELDFVRSGPELIGAFRTPSLRNLEQTAPFMHKGQIATLGEVLQHYNDAPPAMIGHNEAKPLNLRVQELRQLETFLHTLAAPVAADSKWLRPPRGSATGHSGAAEQ